MASPRPVPFPVSFVVKKGSKSFVRCSFEIPGPVSVKETSAIPSFASVLTVRVPPFSRHGIACVKNDIHKDLLNLISIDIEHRKVGFKFLDNLDVLEWGLLFDEADRSLDQGMDVPLFLVRLPLTGKIQKPLDDIPAAGSLLNDRFEVFFPWMVLVHLLEQEGTEREDPGEGIVDLMGHTRRKLSKGSHLSGMDELVLNLLKFLGSLLNAVFEGLGPSFDGIAGMLQLGDHIVERFGEISQFIMGPNGNGLIQISIGSLLGCSEEFIDGPIDESGDQKTQEKTEKDDTDDPGGDHLSVESGPFPFQTLRD